MKRPWLFMVSLLAVLLPQLAQAQAWPQRPVRVVVPYPPGGSTDVQARMISERLTAAFGQQFVVDNRPGAGGAIAAEIVARAPADGYTLFFGATPQLLTVPLIQKVSYDPLKDFALVFQKRQDHAARGGSGRDQTGIGMGIQQQRDSALHAQTATSRNPAPAADLREFALPRRAVRRRGWARKARRVRRTYVERRFNTLSKSSSTPST